MLYSFQPMLLFHSLHSRHLEEVGERENGRARARHARVRKRLHGRPLENRFNSHSVSKDIFQLVERLQREKLTAWGEKTVNQ